MKTIKSKFIICALTLAFVWNTTSCTDEISPKSELPEATVTGKLIYLEPLVKGLYKEYLDTKAGRNGLMTNLGLDESQQGNLQLISGGQQPGLDKYNGLLNPLSPQVQTVWDNRWPAVHTAMLAIEGLEKNQEDPEKVKRLLGEASFVRAMLTMELSMYWGEVAIKDRKREAEIKTSRRPLKEVWEFIINDFKVAIEKLPDTNTPGRATKGAAWAMLGKAYMYAPEETGFRNFQLAKDAFDKIKGKYRLVPNFEDLFAYDKPNSVESIYELQFNNLDNDSNHWQFDTGSRAVDSWFTQGCYFSGYDFLVPTPFTYKTVAEGGLWEDGDLRKEASLRYDFTYNGVTPDLSKTTWTGTTDELDPHIKKFEDPRTDRNNGSIGNMWNSGKNFAVIRYADIILLYAECLNELGNTTEAINLVNDEIRTRAWGGTLPADKKWLAMGQDQFRDEIMDERIRELCFEGWRRMDLIRTGKFVKLVKERNSWAKAENALEQYHMRYPIPDVEIKLNEDITDADQNPGYKK